MWTTYRGTYGVPFAAIFAPSQNFARAPIPEFRTPPSQNFARPHRTERGQQHSVATAGGPAFHPISLSLGNLHDDALRAHPNAILPIAFLAISQVSDAHQEVDPEDLRAFRRQLYRASLEMLFAPLEGGLQRREYDVTRCPDGHYRRAVYQLGPVVVDMPFASGADIEDSVDAEDSAHDTADVEDVERDGGEVPELAAALEDLSVQAGGVTVRWM
ncbi:hypothetical protein EVJ58_g2069 [Rhodofomes roseus]|uniref:Uncharacterized protein n=1 Tax=Rhodofomes roseus TaxID=34475 RepID=A0A4Y9YU74_9APHY|nr:hypothetical protein EVJ58_g2069 [Rhodofomes roseus]